MNMRNATCVRTQTSKDPTRVALLFISYSMPWTKVTRPRLLMDFTLRCVRIFPGVNSRAELVTLAPGLHPERRFAPLARGL